MPWRSSAEKTPKLPTVSHYKTETVFDYPWNQVAIAYWNRYPNPASTHVLTEDTVSREVRDGVLYTRRLLSKTNPVPKWGERFYKNAPVKIIEDSVLDPQARTLTTYTRNIGFKKIMKVDEIVEYSEQQDGRTLAVRRAYISSQVFGFSRAIRAFAIERFKSNCLKAATGFNHVLRQMFPNQAMAAVPSTMLTSDAAESAIVANSKSAEQPSRMERLKRASKMSYDYVKLGAVKFMQMFSVKN